MWTLCCHAHKLGMCMLLWDWKGEYEEAVKPLVLPTTKEAVCLNVWAAYFTYRHHYGDADEEDIYEYY